MHLAEPRHDGVAQEQQRGTQALTLRCLRCFKPR